MNLHEPVSPETIQDLLVGVDKPARYIGGELNSVVKAEEVRCRMALCFPDVYEVAESHIGLKILYNIVNQREDFAAERVYALWPDLEQKATAQGVPLWSLETYRPLAMFDVIGFTLQYELSYPTVLGMLMHGGVPLRTQDRDSTHPFVIGGGAGAFNAEPIADFFDGFLLGDGEEAVLQILEVIAGGRARGASREEILHELGRVDGMYIPSHYEVTYNGIEVQEIRALPGTPKAHITTKHRTPRITRTTVADLDSAPYPTKTIVPNVKPVHDRVAIEIQRGCSQACRFCQAGMITRPTRQRKPETVLKLAEESLQSCGSDQLGLLSLSAGDYQPINEVLSEFFNRYQEDMISVSLPSMRTETMTPELAKQVATVRKSGFTLAPEAGSERMRRVINKTNTEENLMNAVRATAQAGWRLLKFYFMIGLPTETDEDVDAIAQLGERARQEGRKICKDLNVTVSVSTFVPKPHTSFQWERQITVEETRRKQQRLADRLRKQGIGLRYHSPELSWLEGVVSRGDRRLSYALEAAARAGCRLDAWSEHFNLKIWERVLHEELAPFGLEPNDYLQERSEKGLLPWDHLDAGILKKFLLRERKRAYQEATIDDCAFTDHCYACGGCDLGNPYHGKNQQGERLVQLRPTVFSELDEEHRSAAELVAERPQGARAGDLRAARMAVIDAEQGRTRLRFQYAKLGRAFHMSHLDVKEHLERAVRLSKLPVVYSQGFSPRPRMNFTPACATGIASEAEYMEVTCHGHVDARAAAERLRTLLPDGLFVINVEEVPLKAPTLNDQLRAITYVVSRPQGMTPQAFRQRVEAFQHRDSCLVQVTRKQKKRILDARAQVTDVALVGDQVQLTIAFVQRVTLKVREAVAAIMGAEHALEAKIRKTRITLSPEKAEADPRHGPLGPEGVVGELLDLSAVSERRDLTQPTRRHKSNEPVVIPYAE